MEKNIKIEDILAFFEKAMAYNLNCWIYHFSDKNISCNVSYNGNIIEVSFYKDKYYIAGNNHEYIEIKHEFTEREKLALDQLCLSIKEYNEKKALNMFRDFLKINKEKPVDIYDLDNDEDD